MTDNDIQRFVEGLEAMKDDHKKTFIRTFEDMEDGKTYFLHRGEGSRSGWKYLVFHEVEGKTYGFEDVVSLDGKTAEWFVSRGFTGYLKRESKDRILFLDFDLHRARL